MGYKGKSNKEYQREYYYKNREQKLLKMCQYYKNNYEIIQEYQREYYLRNKLKERNKKKIGTILKNSNVSHQNRLHVFNHTNRDCFPFRFYFNTNKCINTQWQDSRGEIELP